MNVKDMIAKAYTDFNNRNIEAILSVMTKDVLWPNGWEGGYVKGHKEVRDYWIRQWKSINGTVEPIIIKNLGNDKYEVEVHQVVKDLEGKLLSDEKVKHIYQFENDLIKTMEII